MIKPQCQLACVTMERNVVSSGDTGYGQPHATSDAHGQLAAAASAPSSLRILSLTMAPHLRIG